MNYVVFALGFNMSSVISKNCLAVVFLTSFFFLFCWSIKMCWVDANLFCQGVLGMVGKSRDPREGQVVILLAGWGLCMLSFLHSYCQPLCHWISFLATWQDTLPVWLQQSQCWPSRTNAPALQHTGLVRQPYSMTLASDASPGVFTWWFLCPKLNFSHEINSMARNKPCSL